MKASIIPYCMAAMLGHAKATGGRVAINYRNTDGPASPLKTLVVTPIHEAHIKYLIVVVTTKYVHGKKPTKKRILCRKIHSMTDGQGQVHTFTDEDRALCIPHYATLATAEFMARI